MLPVLDSARMREADRRTIEDLGIPGIVLMENAATGVLAALREGYPDTERVLVLAGRGNNGGDALALARHLRNGGADVRVLHFGRPADLAGDAAINWRIAKAFGVPLSTADDDPVPALERALAELQPDLIVDGLVGTGLDRPLTGSLAAVVTRIGELDVPVVAIDVPSGLSSNSSIVPGPAVDADLTVTFAALKPCHVLPPACLGCGEVVVADIGIPPSVLEEGCALWLLDADDVALLLPSRALDSHKGAFGHLLVLAGAEGRGGAVALAALAAVVTGAGLVTMAVPRPAVPVVDGACLEAMTHVLEAQADGTVAGPEGLEDLLGRITAVAVGPGMGTGAGAARTLDWVLDRWSGPLLLDADALNLLAAHLGRLVGRPTTSVVTPHPGELARLLGRSTAEVVADRLHAAREAAALSGAVVVAKGFRTIIADPSGEAWICPVGDQHLASGGAGDVLTGTIGSFLAQGLDPLRAALLGCWLHGRAGELGADAFPAAVPASMVPDLIAQAWAELAEDTE